MNLFNSIGNILNASLGRNQAFDQLIKAKDIGRAMAQMDCKDTEINKALQQYNTSTHEVMKRADKMIYTDKGYYERTEKRWKLPIPYQQFINEISLVFLYGRPLKWVQKSKDTDNAFEAFTEFINDTHFNSRIRQCKRLAGAETQSAMLFRVFRNNSGNPECQIRVLAKSKGDDIRIRRDRYDNIVDIGWGYYLKDGDRSYMHFDIYTPNIIYRCRRSHMGWEVIEENNPIGKIPLIVFQQNSEWSGVNEMIDREEFVISRSADTNDYLGDPTMIIAADMIAGSLPNKKEEAKLLVVKGVENVDKAAKLLSWDSAPKSKEMELSWLQQHILSKSFTPNFDFENMKGLSKVSAKAMKQMTTLANIKADRHKETHDELLDRIGSLTRAIIDNVLNISLKAQCEKLKLGHIYQEPFGEDISEIVKNLVDLKDAELISQEGGIELNPLIENAKEELQRIRKETEQTLESTNTAQQRDIFNPQN